MYKDNKLLIAKNNKEELFLLPRMINRHGIITGASGSGKTTTLKVIAESMSEAGIPVFLVDIKGDLAGTAKIGEEKGFVVDRVNKLGLTDFKYQRYPVTFYDINGTKGHPIRTTVENIGSKLLSKMLNLTDTQEGVLAIIFQISQDENLELIDLKDLKALLNYVSDNRDTYSSKYGNITKQSIGSILRNLLILEQEGGNLFFGKPSFELKDLIYYDPNTGYGNINIFDSQELFKQPTLYAIFLIWILNEIYNTFPEVGDLDKPKLTLFFDEAHLLFSEMPNYIVKQIIGIIKLIRSKGVGVYFISQSPSDIPDEILKQLGNKIQHVLRSYTPLDEKNIKAAINSFRINPELNMEEEIKSLKIGEALVSFLNEDGEPNIVSKAYILPPTSKTGVLTDTERQEIVRNSRIYNKYENLIDEISAYEKLEKQNNKEKTTNKGKTAKKTNNTLMKKYTRRIANRAINTIGRKIGNQIYRGLFK